MSLNTSAAKRRRRDDRILFALAYLGGVCESCGATQYLEFDHIDPATMSFRIQDTRGLDKNILDFVDELEKCQLLCLPCHVKKTNKQRKLRDIPHGTASRYNNKKCRCNLCRDAWRVYHGEYVRKYRLLLKSVR